MKSHQPFSTLWAAACGFFEIWKSRRMIKFEADAQAAFLYHAWTWTEDPRNEHGFEFMLKAATETEAFDFGNKLMATYYPEFHINLPTVSILEDVLFRHSNLTALSTNMTEDEISSLMARDRKRRFYIPPAARAH